MKKEGLLTGLFIFVMLIGVVQASTLNVEVGTLEDHKLEVQFLNPDRMNSQPISYGKYLNDTGDGQLSFDFESTADSYDLSVFLMDGNDIILHKLFEGVSADQKIYLLLIPGASEITENYEEETAQVSSNESMGENQEVNETAEIVTEKQNQTNSSSSGLEGFAIISETLDLFSNKLFYYIGSGLVLALAGFLVLRRVYKKGTLKLKLPKRQSSDSLEDAEEKIKEAEGEIQELRKRSKLDDAKKKLIEDEKELMKLRKEEEDKKKK
jgi:hypothetical protein